VFLASRGGRVLWFPRSGQIRVLRVQLYQMRSEYVHFVCRLPLRGVTTAVTTISMRFAKYRVHPAGISVDDDNSRHSGEPLH
jgi:hypothetical protein